MGPTFSRLAAAAAVLLLAAAAAAQSVHEIQAGGDAVSGTISAGDDVDRVPFRLPQGAVLSISLKAAKGSLLHPDLVVLGVDREPDPAINGALVVAKKLNAVSLKNHVLAESGLRWLEIRGADGTTGGWTLTMKVKLPKKAAATGTTAAGEGEILIAGPGNATATLTVVAGKGSAAVPASPTLLDPLGEEVFVDDVLTSTKGFTARNVRMGLIGTWTLRFTTPADGAWTFKASFALPKPVKRALTEDQVITDPAISGLSPTSGDTSQILPATLDVSFAQPGAIVTFRKTPKSVTYSGSAVAITEEGIDFTMILSAYEKGDYDLEVVNPDGGSDSLEDAFTVANAAPQPASILPASGRDTEVVVATISGGYFTSGVACSLAQGAASIPGTVQIQTSTSITAQFDLRGRPLGAWDVVVQNADTPPATLDDAFTILNTAPTVTSISPTNDVGASAFTAIVGGTEFEANPAVVLRKTGFADITASSVQFVGPTRVDAAFDTTGAPGGVRDVVFTNADGLSSTLANSFFVAPPIGSGATALSLAGAMDAVPAVALNTIRGDSAMAWVETNGSNCDVFAQRIDASGFPVGTKVTVSSQGSTPAKKDVAISWDSTNDQYLVVWSEAFAPGSNFAATHPSYGYTSLFHVMGQRLAGANLAASGSNVKISDHTLLAGWYMDEFNNQRATLCWNTSGKYWTVYWMQEWSTRNINNYGYDDYDVMGRTFSGTGTMGTPVAVATTGYHEGDPHCVWDGANNRNVLTYNGATANGNPLNVYLGPGGTGTLVASTASGHLVDPQVCLDTTNGRVLLTWTSLPSSGPRSVQGLLVSASSLTTLIGSPVTIASGSDDHLAARAVWDPVSGNALVTWSSATSTPSYSARRRRVDTSGSTLGLLDSEAEVSGGSGDETAPLAVPTPQGGVSAVYWLQTLSFTSAGAYNNSIVAGTYRGRVLRFVRYDQ